MILATAFALCVEGQTDLFKAPQFMSRKPKKGYFVRGQFVAEGSELDLELKAELKGTEGLSRTDRKKDSDDRQDLGVELLTLRGELIERLNAQGHMTDQLRETVEGAIRRLPEDLRTALTLREFEGLSYEEIAEAMSCPVGTVRSRIFRAREAVDAEILPLIQGN